MAYRSETCRGWLLTAFLGLAACTGTVPEAADPMRDNTEDRSDSTDLDSTDLDSTGDMSRADDEDVWTTEDDPEVDESELPSGVEQCAQILTAQCEVEFACDAELAAAEWKIDDVSDCESAAIEECTFIDELWCPIEVAEQEFVEFCTSQIAATTTCEDVEDNRVPPACDSFFWDYYVCDDEEDHGDDGEDEDVEEEVESPRTPEEQCTAILTAQCEGEVACGVEDGVFSSVEDSLECAPIAQLICYGECIPQAEEESVEACVAQIEEEAAMCSDFLEWSWLFGDCGVVTEDYFACE